MKRHPNTARSEPANSFEQRVRVALERVRTALGSVVGPVLGTQDVRAADLVAAFAVDTHLAWKFVKFMSTPNVLTVVRYLPGERGVRMFLRAAARRDAPEAAIRAAREAFAALDAFVRQEAGDRKSFDMMVCGHAVELADDPGLAHRKAAFEHNGYIWGVQTRTQIHSYLIQPSDDGEHLDVAAIRGFVGLRRVRPQTPWRVSRFYSIDEEGRVRGTFEREPLDPRCGADEVPLLRRFCSQRLPAVRRRVGRHGIVDYVLAESDVGNARAVTCLTGEVLRRAEPCYPHPQYTALGTFVPLRTPCELVVADVFLRRDFFGTVTPALSLLSDLFNETLGADYSEGDRLPCPCKVVRLGDGPQVPPIGSMPTYADMIDYCFDRLAWDPAQFTCYRVRLTYPPMPATLVADYPLPDRPST